ncbi:histone deacetylase family protein [Candidatus Pacearchaeota archaeon]|nr:histone deacetylase family protein [Candidatus Pacearchaeota archaeon]MBD3283570.1 histone deacetylase family protein [Candidatus Pacearchaeota archaeon]
MHPENKKRVEKLNIRGKRVENGERYLKLFHDNYYVKEVKDACKREERLDPDTVTSKGSYNSAVHAVGATIMASKKNNFAVVRPPGHHAHPGNSSGFCIFNNIAIAVQKLVKEGKRVLIFDFDSHLGDGTEKFFYNSDKVLYWSIHQFPAFPGFGWVDEIGDGKGKGFTINVPLPPESADDLYLDAIERFLPIAKQFNPDVVAVSAGFDGYKEDLLLNLKFSINSYYETGKILRKNFKNVFATLEGGYNIQILPKCIFNFLDGINNSKQRFNEDSTKSSKKVVREYNSRIKKLGKNLLRFW